MVKNLKQLSAHIYDEDSTPNIPTSENQTQNTKPNIAMSTLYR
jgi:hypothetical protein